MEIKKNAPEPVIQPPATYDILGLTEDQLLLIRDILGKFSASGPTHKIYREIYNSLSVPVKYGVFLDRDRVWSLTVHPS